MSTQIDNLHVTISDNINPLLRGLKKAEVATNTSAAKMELAIKTKLTAGFASVEKMAVGKMLNIGKVIALAFGAAGVAAIKMAIDAEESEDKFVMSMGAMEKSSREFSETFGKEIGRSAYDIRDYVSTLYTMLKSMGVGSEEAQNMAHSMTKLAYDTSSFFNIPLDEAFGKIRSGLTGEAEPLKQLGILVNDTTIKNYALTTGMIQQGEKLTELQKVQARYGQILASTTNIQNNAKDTSNSTQNILRQLLDTVKDLAIVFGKMLTPAVKEVGNSLIQYISANEAKIIATFKSISDKIIYVTENFEEVKETVIKAGKAFLGLYASIKVLQGLHGLSTLMAGSLVKQAAKQTLVNSQHAIEIKQLTALNALLAANTGLRKSNSVAAAYQSVQGMGANPASRLTSYSVLPGAGKAAGAAGKAAGGVGKLAAVGGISGLAGSTMAVGGAAMAGWQAGKLIDSTVLEAGRKDTGFVTRTNGFERFMAKLFAGGDAFKDVENQRKQDYKLEEERKRQADRIKKEEEAKKKLQDYQDKMAEERIKKEEELKKQEEEKRLKLLEETENSRAEKEKLLASLQSKQSDLQSDKKSSLIYYSGATGSGYAVNQEEQQRVKETEKTVNAIAKVEEAIKKLDENIEKYSTATV